VHETEGRVIPNGGRDIGFTMGSAGKDADPFEKTARRHDVPLETSPVPGGIFGDGFARCGACARSSSIVRCPGKTTGPGIRAPGLPSEIIDDGPEAPGCEVIPQDTRPRGGDA